MKKLIVFAFAIFTTMCALAQPTPGPAQSESILIVGATAHLGKRRQD